MTSPYPETAWEIPWMHVAFENAGAVASGVESALRIQGKDDINVIAFGGDGGTVDIGLQSLSGAMERGHNLTYICYDNEAYMNTGIQRSGATPYGASTTTSPKGSGSFGEDKPKKDMPMIMAAHGIPYVATASIAYPEDFVNKVKKAAAIKGPAYIHLHQPCTTGWGFASEKTIEMGRLAVETGSWILYEVENGELVNIQFRKIAYDYEAELESAKAKGLPFIEMYEELRREENYQGHNRDLLASLIEKHEYAEDVKNYFEFL